MRDIAATRSRLAYQRLRRRNLVVLRANAQSLHTQWPTNIAEEDRNWDLCISWYPAATRPWQHVLEPLSGYLTLARALSVSEARDGESYNFGPRAEQNRTVVDLIGDLGDIWGLGSDAEAYEVTDNIPFHEASLLKLNRDKALLDLDWEANLKYEECVEMTGSWYRRALKDKEKALAVTLEQIANFEALAGERR